MEITTPIQREILKKLKPGDKVEITGYIYTARDAAHKRFIEAIGRGENLPIDVINQIIYYAGPSPAKPGDVVGSCGPTTSGRMDNLTPPLLDLGLGAMIGKGPRSDSVVESCIKNGSVYFAATGGAGALLAQRIKTLEVVCYEDLGTESVKKLFVEKFPVTVVIDTFGNNLYENGENTIGE